MRVSPVRLDWMALSFIARRFSDLVLPPPVNGLDSSDCAARPPQSSSSARGSTSPPAGQTGSSLRSPSRKRVSRVARLRSTERHVHQSPRLCRDVQLCSRQGPDGWGHGYRRRYTYGFTKRTTLCVVHCGACASHPALRGRPCPEKSGGTSSAHFYGTQAFGQLSRRARSGATRAT